MIGFSHAAATDMPFSGMLTIAMVCAAVVLGLTRTVEDTPILPHTPWLALVLFGFFLGLAVLAKGPAAIILSGGAIFFWALFTRRWRDAFRLFHPAAITSFCLTALPWYMLCARRNPDFFRIFIIEHNFKRYLTPEFQHIQPFWYYVPIALLALLPWSSMIVGVASDFRRTLAEGAWRFSPDIYFASWIAFVFIFFSASKSKLPGYLLPAVPAVGIFLAQSISRRILEPAQHNRWIGNSTGIVLFSLGVLAALNSDSLPLTPSALALIGGGLISAVLGSLRRLSSSLVMAVLAVIFAITLALVGASRQMIDDSVSARSVLQAASIVWRDYSPEKCAIYKLPRSFQYSLNFYFHRELPEWSANQSIAGWVFTSPKEEYELRKRGLDCPFNTLRHAVIVCRDPGSAGSLNDGRQSQ
jgi:4-amino-4-deoxy-L-arabinose transferase-like glycosyltransferase